MLYATFAFIAMGLTIAAFVLRGTASAFLRITAMLAWIIMIPLSFAQAWPIGNTFLPQGSAYFCVIMVIVMLTATIIYYVDWFKGRHHIITDEEYQREYRRTIYNLTKKKDVY